ncbi:MAG: PKD domain-containing protein, partial [Bacteroidota bacterium]
DTDNNWNNINAQMDEVATDAHWGTEMTYDYFYNMFGRNSIDNSGFKLLSYVHFDYYYANAFWDGYRMTYGDGDGYSMTPLTALDIIGHEITHGLTSYTADLVYSYESGALNEGFSDIFGTAIEFYAKPGSANWTVGEDIGEIIRSLQNPNSYSLPDTYQGNYWYTGSGDNGGVHTNCGVIGHWFYLTSAGGSGVNDLGNSYTVTGIGIDKAAAISYRMLAVYMTNTSQYSDARTFAIQSAIDLYGSCSTEVESVTNAMYAVGLGSQYNSSVIASFSANATYCCSYPVNITFSNSSVNGTSYLWNFGDGNTSTLQNPTHTYTNPGLYSVSLITTGSASCGSSVDTLLITDYITVSNYSGPVTPYCTPQTINPGSYGMGIFNFSLNTINNTTSGATDGYQDYTCSISTNLTEGNIYNVSVITGSSYSENVKIWIDYNADGQFNSTNEQVFVSENLIQYHSGNIFIQPGAILDSAIRLRVGSDFYNYDLINACTDSEYGQYEDYTVRILENIFPPAVDFEANYTTISTGQTVNFTDLTQNVPTGWQWEFQGGIPSVSSLQNPTVTYNSLGSFPVKLVATNAFGTDSLIKTSYINVVNIFNLCSGIDSTNATSGILYDSGGPSGNFGYNENCSLLINPGCAISVDFTLNYLYMPSSYDRLKVYDGFNNSGTLLLDSYLSSAPITVSATSGIIFIEFYSNSSSNYAGFEASWNSVIPSNPPVADFAVSDINPPLNSPVDFTDQTSFNPGSWLWDFGDGTNSIEQNPTHYFMTPGFKTIILISDNCYSTDTVSYSLTVQDSSVFMVNPDTLYATIVNCDDSTSYPLTIYNNGAGDLDFTLSGAGSSGSSSIELLALTYGVDYTEEYLYTLNAIDQYFTNYNLTEINTTSAANLQTALVGKDVLLIAEQESGSSTVFTGFATTLQNFVNDGGTVIFCGTSNYSCIFNTGLFSGTNGSNASGGTLTVLNNTHQITDGLPSSIPGQNATYTLTITNTDAVKLVKYGSYDAVAYREVNTGKVVFIAYDFYDYDNYAAQIIANAVEWGGMGGSVDWIHLSGNSGSVTPSDSALIYVTFSSAGLNGGVFTGEIIINSNDPLNPQISVPCTINVSYDPCGDFTYNIPNLCSGQVDFTDNSLNNPTSWHWDFGDGNISSIQNPTHFYATPGNYSVQLIICNAISCDTINSSVSVVNTSGPILALCTPGSNYTYTTYDISKVIFNTINNSSTGSATGYEDYTCVSSTNLIQGLSYPVTIQTLGSYNKNICVWIDYNNNGSFETGELVFDTLNSISPHVGNIFVPTSSVVNTPIRMRVACDRYSYSAPQPCVNVYYGEFEDYTIVLQSNTLPPNASYYYNVLDMCQGAFQFVDNSSNIPTSWQWNFGDGTTSSYQNPYHSYNNAGIYTVTLTVSNSFGTDTYTYQITVNSLNPDIIYNGFLAINQSIQFSTNAIGVLSWQWNFGDGNTSALPSPSHIYTVSGNYTVTLEVQNAVGCFAQAFLNLFIDYQIYVETSVFDKIEIYPNPAKDILYIENSSNYNSFKIEIISISGQVIKSDVLDSPKNAIDIDDINPGVYFINIFNDEVKYITKLTIM